MITGTLITVIGLVLSCLSTTQLEKGNAALWIIDVLDALLGLIDGLIEPIILHKIVTRSNRPEFFTSLFYGLASISSIYVVSIPR